MRMRNQRAFKNSFYRQFGFTLLEVSIVMILLSSLTVAVTQVAYKNYNNGVVEATLDQARLIASDAMQCKTSNYGNCANILNYVSGPNSFGYQFSVNVANDNFVQVSTVVPFDNLKHYKADVAQPNVGGTTTLIVYSRPIFTHNEIFIANVSAQASSFFFDPENYDGNLIGSGNSQSICAGSQGCQQWLQNLEDWRLDFQSYMTSYTNYWENIYGGQVGSIDYDWN